MVLITVSIEQSFAEMKPIRCLMILFITSVKPIK